MPKWIPDKINKDRIAILLFFFFFMIACPHVISYILVEALIINHKGIFFASYSKEVLMKSTLSQSLLTEYKINRTQYKQITKQKMLLLPVNKKTCCI